MENLLWMEMDLSCDGLRDDDDDDDDDNDDDELITATILFFSANFFRRVRKLLKATVRFVTHVCPAIRSPTRPPAWSNSAPTGQIFMKFDFFFVFLKTCREN